MVAIGRQGDPIPQRFGQADAEAEHRHREQPQPEQQGAESAGRLRQHAAPAAQVGDREGPRSIGSGGVHLLEDVADALRSHRLAVRRRAGVGRVVAALDQGERAAGVRVGDAIGDRQLPEGAGRDDVERRQLGAQAAERSELGDLGRVDELHLEGLGRADDVEQHRRLAGVAPGFERGRLRASVHLGRPHLGAGRQTDAEELLASVANDPARGRHGDAVAGVERAVARLVDGRVRGLDLAVAGDAHREPWRLGGLRVAVGVQDGVVGAQQQRLRELDRVDRAQSVRRRHVDLECGERFDPHAAALDLGVDGAEERDGELFLLAGHPVGEELDGEAALHRLGELDAQRAGVLVEHVAAQRGRRHLEQAQPLGDPERELAQRAALHLDLHAGGDGGADVAERDQRVHLRVEAGRLGLAGRADGAEARRFVQVAIGVGDGGLHLVAHARGERVVTDAVHVRGLAGLEGELADRE